MHSHKADNCNHPARNRTPLKSGDGFHCESCNQDVKVAPKSLVQTDKMSVSFSTVESIGLNSDQKERVKKDKRENRRVELSAMESQAKRIVKEMSEIRNESQAFASKMKDKVREMYPLFENVRYGFAHLHIKEGETIMGETTGEEWSPKYLGITYRHLCRLMNAAKAEKNLLGGNVLLLTDGEKAEKPAAKKKAEKAETPTLHRGDGTPIPSAVYNVGDAVRNTETYMDSIVKGFNPIDENAYWRAMETVIGNRVNKTIVLDLKDVMEAKEKGVQA